LGKVYLVSGAGGTYVNFLCSVIGTDANFGSLPFHGFVTQNNDFSARELDIQQWIKDKSTGEFFPEMTEEMRRNINSHLQEKNLLLNTHYFSSKSVSIEDCTRIRFYMKKEDCVLPYLMFLAKVTTKKDILTDTFIKNLTNKISEKEIDKLAPWQTVNRLTVDAFCAGMAEEDFVINYYEIYRTQVSKRYLPNWLYLNPNDLLFEPEKFYSFWKDTFNMLEPFNISILKEYHQKNLNLVKNMFGIDFNRGQPFSYYRSALIDFAKKFKTPMLLKT